jgi:hypothetical protein
MSVKKNKRKAIKHQNHSSKEITSRSILSRYPKIFLVLSILLISLGVGLLTMGHVSDAKVGLSMILLFFGLALAMFANASLPKKGVISK